MTRTMTLVGLNSLRARGLRRRDRISAHRPGLLDGVVARRESYCRCEQDDYDPTADAHEVSGVDRGGELIATGRVTGKAAG